MNQVMNPPTLPKTLRCRDNLDKLEGPRAPRVTIETVTCGFVYICPYYTYSEGEGDGGTRGFSRQRDPVSRTTGRERQRGGSEGPTD